MDHDGKSHKKMIRTITGTHSVVCQKRTVLERFMFTVPDRQPASHERSAWYTAATSEHPIIEYLVEVDPQDRSEETLGNNLRKKI